MNKITAAFLLLCFSVSAFASVGASEKELSARFGEPILRSKDAMISQGKVIELWPRLIYRQDDWTIQCDIVEGKCARISYSKPGEWTEDQFLAVLTSNAQGAKWTDISKENKNMKREWKREDAATANWHMLDAMVVTTPAYERAKSIAEAKAKAASSQIPRI